MRDLDPIFLEKRISELEKGGAGGGSSADKISYNNAESGLTANNVQTAIDEVHEEVENFRHHYSSDEKIVGEWIDGKPIYERTINNFKATASSYDSLVDNNPIYSKMIDCRCIIDSNGTVIQGLVANSNNDRAFLHINSDHKLYMAIGSSFLNINIDIIVQYTKV